jgi:hypothetical protein
MGSICPNGDWINNPLALYYYYHLKRFSRLAMDLDEQIRVLIDNAPQDGSTPRIVKAIAPLLKQLAVQLRHREYYILQSMQEQWVVTTLSNRAQPEMEKRVIYAFATVDDAKSASGVTPDSGAIAIGLPVTHILFQTIVLRTVDSLIFFEEPGRLESGTEVRGNDIRNLVQAQLQRTFASPQSDSQIPPDMA